MDCIFFEAEDGIRDFCLSRGVGDGEKREREKRGERREERGERREERREKREERREKRAVCYTHLTRATILRVSIEWGDR